MNCMLIVASPLICLLTSPKVKVWRQLGKPDPHCRELEHLKLILGSAHCDAQNQFKFEQSARAASV